MSHVSEGGVEVLLRCGAVQMTTLLVLLTIIQAYALQSCPVPRMWQIYNNSPGRLGVRCDIIQNVEKEARAVQPDSVNAGLKSLGGRRLRGDLEGIAGP